MSFCAPSAPFSCPCVPGDLPFKMRFIEYFFLPKENVSRFRCIFCTSLDVCLCVRIYNPETYIPGLFVCLFLGASFYSSNCVIRYQIQMSLPFLQLILSSAPHASMIHSIAKLLSGMSQTVTEARGHRSHSLPFLWEWAVYSGFASLGHGIHQTSYGSQGVPS